MAQGKSYEISKQVVWEAYKRVKANRGAAGVDQQSLEDFETDLKGNLYKIWNRMSSGSYFPPPVRLVEIPKGQGGTRPLGIPTVADRIAQMVAKIYLEPLLEPHFHPDSYGYRPGKSALDAVAAARQRCWRQDWVIDLDIKGFLDTASGCPFKNASCGAYRRAVCGIAPRFSVDREKGKDQSLCPWPLELYRCEFGRESSETERAISRPVGAP